MTIEPPQPTTRTDNRALRPFAITALASTILAIALTSTRDGTSLLYIAGTLAAALGSICLTYTRGRILFSLGFTLALAVLGYQILAIGHAL